MATPDIALVSGFWGQNIGNAFFNLGGKYLLESVAGVGRVAFIQDQPGYRTFYPQRRGNPDNWWNPISKVEADVVVLQGPVLTSTVMNLWAETVRALRSRGVRFLLLGVGLFKYSPQEIRAAREFLDFTDPLAVLTRDDVTARALAGKVSCPVHSSIDSAFFFPEVAPILPLKDRYIVVNFDRRVEPRIVVHPRNSFNDEFVEWRDVSLEFRFPRVPSWLSSLGKWQAYIGHELAKGRRANRLCGNEIVRPEHRYTPHVARKIYRRPGAVVSDEPWTYAHIYANSELTLSDRVHACVATLAFGGEAMLFSPSPRRSLFEAVGAGEIHNRPVSLDLEELSAMKGVAADLLARYLV